MGSTSGRPAKPGEPARRRDSRPAGIRSAPRVERSEMGSPPMAEGRREATSREAAPLEAKSAGIQTQWVAPAQPEIPRRPPTSLRRSKSSRGQRTDRLQQHALALHGVSRRSTRTKEARPAPLPLGEAALRLREQGELCRGWPPVPRPLAALPSAAHWGIVLLEENRASGGAASPWVEVAASSRGVVDRRSPFLSSSRRVADPPSPPPMGKVGVRRSPSPSELVGDRRSPSPSELVGVRRSPPPPAT